ncbi:TldD/PmbA family protein [Oceanicaulis sp.]|uniref:TldD/PmbA family protein n=1 Tax=Oceanicaulis sp. TaxID=1924941 RepID=UPI003F722E88
MTDQNASAGLGAPDTSSLLSLAHELVDRAKAAGAQDAEALLSESRAIEAGVREGKLETVERSETRDAGLRVLIGKRQAGVAFSDLSEAGMSLAVERAVAMAKAAPEDPYCGLVEPDKLARNLPDIATYEASDFTPEQLEAAALEMEAAALGVKGVAMTSGCGASAGVGGSAFVTSTGFERARLGSRCGLGVAAIARDASGAMERDYDTHAARRRSDLKTAQEIGLSAGERAVSRVGAEKLATGKMAVVFDKRVSTTFISSLLGAISGPAIARGTSFLRDKMGERLFSEGVDVIEDPLRDWSFGARAVDAEGIACTPRALIEDGVLTSWLLNASSARQLGLELTGHASRNLGGAPGVGASNVHLSPGELDRDGLIEAAGTGVLVSEMFGPSLNANTGDWSVGVAGYAIENGKLGGPVSEITVAGNLLDIFARLVPGSDLEFDSSINAPSVLVDALSIGGR